MSNHDGVRLKLMSTVIETVFNLKKTKETDPFYLTPTVLEYRGSNQGLQELKQNKTKHFALRSPASRQFGKCRGDYNVWI